MRKKNVGKREKWKKERKKEGGRIKGDKKREGGRRDGRMEGMFDEEKE